MDKRLEQILAPAFGPCDAFSSTCASMRWSPESGHVPRGFSGASNLSKVQLILVNAEPGDPLADESYPCPSPRHAEAVATEFLKTGQTRFHRNLRLLLDLCFPGKDFEAQHERVWITNAVICSAEKLGGSVPRACEELCFQKYLSKQLDLFPNAFVIALGEKAVRRIKRGSVKPFNAFHPSARVSNEERRNSYESAAREFRKSIGDNLNLG